MRERERNLIEMVEILTNTTNQSIDRYQRTEFHSTCSLVTPYHTIIQQSNFITKQKHYEQEGEKKVPKPDE